MIKPYTPPLCLTPYRILQMIHIMNRQDIRLFELVVMMCSAFCLSLENWSLGNFPGHFHVLLCGLLYEGLLVALRLVLIVEGLCAF